MEATIKNAQAEEIAKKKVDIYTVLGWLGMIGTPSAAASIFGIRVYGLLVEMTTVPYLPAISAILTAAGLEVVGIFAGHTAMEAWRIKRYWYAIIAGIALIVYAVIGAHELTGTIGQRVFIIAPITYLLIGLRDSLHTIAEDEAAVREQERKEKEKAAEAERLEQERAAAFDREQKALDKQAERNIKAHKERGAHEERMAKIEAEKKRLEAVTKRVDMPVSNQDIPSDYRLLTEQQKSLIKRLSSGELQEMADISASTARRWKRKVAANGHHI